MATLCCQASGSEGNDVTETPRPETPDERALRVVRQSFNIPDDASLDEAQRDLMFNLATEIRLAERRLYRELSDEREKHQEQWNAYQKNVEAARQQSDRSWNRTLSVINVLADLLADDPATVEAARAQAQALLDKEAERPIGLAAPASIRGRLARYRDIITELLNGLEGKRRFAWRAVDHQHARPVLRVLGVNLMSKTAIKKAKLRLKRGAQPVGEIYFERPISNYAEVYLAEAQCARSDAPEEGDETP
jgi:hypothetical protein